MVADLGSKPKKVAKKFHSLMLMISYPSERTAGHEIMAVLVIPPLT